MLNDLCIQDAFSEEDLRLMEAVAKSESTNFCELAELAGLDPKNDFRHSNLSEVDFSDCDLRGFDFTGANLMGSFGSNIILNDSTCFDKADTAGSVFHFEAECRQTLKLNPEIDKFRKILAKSHWAEQALWGGKLWDKRDEMDGTEMLVATYLVEHSTDDFAVTEVLNSMEHCFPDKEMYKSYVYSVLGTKSAKDQIFSFATRILDSPLFNDERADDTLLSLCTHVDYNVQYRALSALTRVSRYPRVAKQLKEIFWSDDLIRFRKTLLFAACRSLRMDGKLRLVSLNPSSELEISRSIANGYVLEGSTSGMFEELSPAHYPDFRDEISLRSLSDAAPTSSDQNKLVRILLELALGFGLRFKFDQEANLVMENSVDAIIHRGVNDGYIHFSSLLDFAVRSKRPSFSVPLKLRGAQYSWEKRSAPWLKRTLQYALRRQESNARRFGPESATSRVIDRLSGDTGRKVGSRR